MTHLKKLIKNNNFNFIKLGKIEFTMNRLELDNRYMDQNNLDQYIFHYQYSDVIDKLVNKIKKNLPDDAKIILPINNGKLKTSSYNVKKINQTNIINHQNSFEKPKKKDICDCVFFVDNVYSFSDNPNIYRFKIKISNIEIIY